tara:strand:+ start:263 stop:559 length:297 start_codon:yes stop_codon:yes gene_type:complete
MKISYKKNILFIFLVLILFAFTLCVLNNNTVIENYTYGHEGCAPENPKVLNIGHDASVIDDAIGCHLEYKSHILGQECAPENLNSIDGLDYCGLPQYR